MTPPPGKVALGGLEVPIKNFGPAIDCLRDHTAKELERHETTILAQERRHYDLQRQIDELTVVVENLRGQVEDSQRPSRVDANFEARVLAAMERPKSDPPDIEYRTASGARTRGQGWVAVVLAVAVVLFAALWQGPELIKAMR